MKKFKLIADVTISIYTEVEAETLEEAIEIAEDREIINSNEGTSDVNIEWLTDEYDGMPLNIREE